MSDIHNEKKTRLFRRDFTIMVIGQIISLFGNSILRFALSLYVLDLTGSAAAFGGILALSMIPTVLLSPVGGMIADRVSRKRIMVALDFSTSALILLFLISLSQWESLAPVTVLLVALSVIQSCYQPAVQASIPSLVQGEALPQANGVVVQVNALSSLLGPILGGFLYAFWGLWPIVIASCACFFLSAVMEIFLHIPFEKRARAGSLLRQSGADLREAFHFISRDNPVLLRLLLVLAGLNFFFSAMITVGLPYLIRVFLGLSGQLYGFAEGSIALGSIAGALLAGLLAKRLRFSRSHGTLLLTGLAILPMGLAVLWDGAPLVSYGVIIASMLVAMGSATVFNVFAQTYLQKKTPSLLLGKVSALVATASLCAMPLGQAFYGALFQIAGQWTAAVVLLGGVAGVFIALYVRRVLRRLED